MAEVFRGFDGYVCVGDTVIGSINHWTITITAETQEVSAFNPTATTTWEKRARKYVPGAIGWTATFDGFFDATDEGQQAIKDAVVEGTEVSLYFHLDGDRYYAGKGLLTSENPDVAWDGVATISWDVQGTGPLEKYGWT